MDFRALWKIDLRDFRIIHVNFGAILGLQSGYQRFHGLEDLRCFQGVSDVISGVYRECNRFTGAFQGVSDCIRGFHRTFLEYQVLSRLFKGAS